MSFIPFSTRIALLASACVAISGATPVMAGCQSGSSASPPTTHLLTSADCQANGSGEGATAVGTSARATADSSIALGLSAFASGDGGVSIGYSAGSALSCPNLVAVGLAAGRDGGHSAFAVGAWSRGIGSSSVAIGGTAFTGDGTVAKGFRSIAIGERSRTGDWNGTAPGFGLGDFGTSIGFNTRTAFAATAVGTDAQAKGDSSTAVGRFANASAASALALGQGAVASRPRSVALGSSSLANVADTVSVGTTTARRRIVNVQNGVANSDAATLGQVKAIATTAAIEALANETTAKAVGDTVSNDLQREVRQMKSMIERLQLEIAELKSQNTAARH